ncbi:MAG: ATP-binding protein [Nitrospiraceae bacterium]
MQEFEKLGVFYLGRPYDLARKQPKPGWLLYDSKDLVTHAVCVGMTGSGKTGLCLSLLEEAAIDGIPAIIIDPKGDLGNLLLTFPGLTGEEFLPWINEDEARKKGVSPADYAKQQAQLWSRGLADWQQDGDRIKRLRDAAEFAIYTPGSNAGLAVSILESFAAPPQDIREDAELFRERINTTTTSLLGLLGIDADPVQSCEHILISTILGQAWRQGQDLDLPALIQQIQTPPVTKIGVMDVDSFFSSKDRFALAMKLNNLLAAPGFQAWIEGEALDIQQILYATSGKPRMAIFSIAHLNDAERMFFVTLLLSQVVGWMRAQSGTTSLRAILYMDEIFGYFPPVANPPSKLPLLTLLKQARAFGLGVVLATQNPVDLDYKGLANTGTWFIGRLQTERDKARVIEGLEGARSGNEFNRGRMEQILAGLGNRIFLMNNVHEDEPVVLETRWVLSYLRGPLTRNQIKLLMEPRKPGGYRTEAQELRTETQSSARNPQHAVLTSRPILPPNIPQHFIPIRGRQPSGSHIVYQPMVLGAGQVRFAEPKAGVNMTKDLTYVTPISDAAVAVSWDDASEVEAPITDLEQGPKDDAQFSQLPTAAGKLKSYEAWNKDFGKWLYRTQKVDLLKSPSTKQVSSPGESERDFRARLQQSGREQRDQEVDRLRKAYAPKIAALQDRIRRAGQKRDAESEQAKAAHVQTAISVGASILSAFLGRKTISSTNIGKVATAARGVGRSMKESQDKARAEENIQVLAGQLQELEARFKTDIDALTSKLDPMSEKLETISVKPNKSNITVKLVVLAWMPHWQDAQGSTTTPAWE